MINVLIDGDNIQMESFLKHVKHIIDAKFGDRYVPTIFCQSNVLIKYKSFRTTQINVQCSTTTNKNASDARIILHTGKLLQQSSENIIIIVSNDKVFEEIVDNVRVHLLGYVNMHAKKKLKKSNIMSVFQNLIMNKKPHEDIFLEDIKEYFHQSLSELRSFILANVGELCITPSEVVFLNIT